MRTIVNISLPQELNKEVEAAVKKGNYASKSEFFRSLLRLWEEEQLLKEIRESEKEFAEGKGKTLKSLKNFNQFTEKTRLILKRELKAGALKSKQMNLNIAKNWFPIEEELWRATN